MTGPAALLVEGQTEAAFVAQVLQPYVGWENPLVPIVVHTSRAADGSARRGGGGWRQYRGQLAALLSQPHWRVVTTMLDFYGFPLDGPRCRCRGPHQQTKCVESREEAMAADMPTSDRFLPFIMLHEFETLVLAAAAAGPTFLDNAELATAFAKLVSEHDGNAERINDGATTAPSKRIARAMPSYRKVRDSVAVLQVSFGSALELTPRFAAWTDRLRAHE